MINPDESTNPHPDPFPDPSPVPLPRRNRPSEAAPTVITPIDVGRHFITPAEAEDLIRTSFPGYTPVTLPLAECQGRILAEDLRADRDQPPFDRIAMDGIAIATSDYRSGCRIFRVEGLQRAGDPPGRLSGPKGCLEAMTGAVLTQGADAVIPVEQLRFENGYAHLLPDCPPPSPYRHVHRAGSDCSSGDVIVPAGVRLQAPQLGAAASFGQTRLAVRKIPRFTIISTGDELVDTDQIPLPHQIRRSNPAAILAALRDAGCTEVTLLSVPDDRHRILEVTRTALYNSDALILTGGVSMGKTDYVPEVLRELGVVERFHKIRQKPGKPMWFGIGPDGRPVFALPGNPAAVLVCLYRYVLPALQGTDASASAPIPVRLPGLEWPSGSLTHFRPVRLHREADGAWRAEFISNQGSGDFSAWACADGFVELDPATLTPAYVPCWRF